MRDGSCRAWDSSRLSELQLGKLSWRFYRGKLDDDLNRPDGKIEQRRSTCIANRIAVSSLYGRVIVFETEPRQTRWMPLSASSLHTCLGGSRCLSDKHSDVALKLIAFSHIAWRRPLLTSRARKRTPVQSCAHRASETIKLENSKSRLGRSIFSCWRLRFCILPLTPAAPIPSNSRHFPAAQ